MLRPWARPHVSRVLTSPHLDVLHPRHPNLIQAVLSSGDPLTQETLTQETLTQKTLTQETLTQMTLTQETLTQMTLYKISLGKILKNNNRT